LWKIEKRTIEKDMVLFLSGRIQGEDLAQLEQTLAAESCDRSFILDLSGVKLVDQWGVLFLANCERTGTRLRNCPDYIREWMQSKGDCSTSDRKAPR
jgi:ABC-type transporter Mla MlaB component